MKRYGISPPVPNCDTEDKMKHNGERMEFLKYSSLNVLGMIGLSCYILADTYFVAKGLGSNGLAALNLAIPIYSFIHGSGLMLGIGGATRYSMFQSTGGKEGGNLAFSHTLLFASVFALFFVLSGGFFAEKITVFLGGNGAVFEMSRTYLRVLLFFSPALLCNDIMLCFVRNDGEPRLPMLAMLGGSFSNIVLDYLFIFVFQMGIFGAVFATGLAPVISLLILSPYFIQKKHQFHVVKCRFSGRMGRNIFAGGFPSLVTEMSSGIVMIVFNRVILGLEGNLGVAAYGIIANLSLVVLSVYTGIAQGIQPLISRYYGKGEERSAKNILKYAFLSILLLSLVLYLILFIGADGIAGIFNSEKNAVLQKIAVSGLKIYFTAGIFVGWNIVLAVYFTSSDCAGPAHVISLLRGFFIVIPMAFILSACWGTKGLWLAFPLTECVVALMGAVLYKKYPGRRKKEIF